MTRSQHILVFINNTLSENLTEMKQDLKANSRNARALNIYSPFKDAVTGVLISP